MTAQESFETVNKATLTNSHGLKYLEFRNSLSPRYSVVWFHIFLGYLGLTMVLVLTGLLQKKYANYFWISIPVAGVMIGYMVSSIHLFMHEASHYHLAADKKRNELLANIFIGLLVGMETNFYRSVHFVHHRLIGTKNDTEKSYFNALTMQFVYESFTGIRVLKVMIHRNRNIKINYGAKEGVDIVKKNKRIFLMAVLLNLLLILSFFLLDYWQVSMAWIFGMGFGFPFFATFRQLLEHRSTEPLTFTDEQEADPGAVHRMFGDGPIASTFGSAGFNRHLLHHWDPSVSYTRLKELEDFLMDTPLKLELQQRQTTYFKTFQELFNR